MSKIYIINMPQSLRMRSLIRKCKHCLRILISHKQVDAMNFQKVLESLISHNEVRLLPQILFVQERGVSQMLFKASRKSQEHSERI